jgi:hypothetical protein
MLKAALPVFAAVFTAVMATTPVLAQIQTPAPAATSSSSASSKSVTVDNYNRDYEPSKTDREIAYDAAIKRALKEKTVSMGALEGSWVVTGSGGLPVLALELRAEASRKVDGAWRMLMTGPSKQSGFVSDVTLYENKLNLYFYGPEKQPVSLTLKHYSDDTWRGDMKNATGKAEAVVMSRSVN